MTAPYALVGEVLTPEAVGLAAIVIQGGKILELVRSPRPKDLQQRCRGVAHGRVQPNALADRDAHAR